MTWEIEEWLQIVFQYLGPVVVPDQLISHSYSDITWPTGLIQIPFIIATKLGQQYSGDKMAAEIDLIEILILSMLLVFNM